MPHPVKSGLWYRWKHCYSHYFYMTFWFQSQVLLLLSFWYVPSNRPHINGLELQRETTTSQSKWKMRQIRLQWVWMHEVRPYILLHPRVCIFPGIIQPDSLLHGWTTPNSKLTLALIPGDAEAAQPPAPLWFMVLSYQTVLGLRICISDKHFDWSVLGATMLPGDVVECTNPHPFLRVWIVKTVKRSYHHQYTM